MKPLPKMDDMVKATLKIEATTRDRLAKLGAKFDSFDRIIVRLLDEHDLHEAVKLKRAKK